MVPTGSLTTDIGYLKTNEQKPQTRGAFNALGAQDSIGDRGITSCLGAIGSTRRPTTPSRSGINVTGDAEPSIREHPCRHAESLAAAVHRLSPAHSYRGDQNRAAAVSKTSVWCFGQRGPAVLAWAKGNHATLAARLRHIRCDWLNGSPGGPRVGLM
jgi:hypothetical protein